MNHRQLGDTSELLPEIGLGTWAYKGGAAPIRRAIELGGAFIDTAELYETEDIVGDAVHDIRDRVFLATKVSPEHFKHKDVIAAADRSLKLLRTDYIDLYQLHWPNDDVPIEETIGAMESLADAGKIRYIGVSNFGPDLTDRAQAALRSHRIVSNQVSYSLLKRRIEEDLIPYCTAKNITIIAYSPLATGIRKILRRDQHGVLSRIAKELGKTEAQVALNWCVTRSGGVAIPKTNSVARVEENCGASGWRLTDADIASLDQIILEPETGLRASAARFVRRLR